VSTKDARSVLRDRLVFALLMAVVVDVHILDVVRVLAISFFVPLTVAVNDANLKVVRSRQWEVPIFALPMAVVVGVLLKAVINQLSLRQNFVSNMEVGRISHPGCEKVSRGRTQFCAAHGGGVRCKLAGCNRVAIGKVQLCRAHGGGARPKNTLRTLSTREAILPLASFIGAGSGSIQGTFCVPIIEPAMGGFGHPQQQQQAPSSGTDLASD